MEYLIKFYPIHFFIDVFPTTHKANSTKKAVFLKNCFDDLYSKNDNSLDYQHAAEKSPKVPFDGLSVFNFQTKRPERSEQSAAKA